jgi:photosystem II stability/assembly factor-like uncharacterized protein
MRRLFLLSPLSFVALAIAGLQAQTSAPQPAPAVNPALFQGLSYRLVGHSRGGRVTTVTGVPSQPRTFYMGVASGGLFRTTDAGENWVPITDGQVPVGSMGDVAVAASDPNIIYLGSGSDGVRSNVSTGRGVYKTIDGGRTWTFAGLYNAGQIGAVRIHPTNPNIVWVAAGGDIFKPNSERGVFKTTDGGATWRKTLYLSDTLGAMDVEIQPGNPMVVYAWMSRLERKPWTIISGSREGGFYKSTDGGERFTKIAAGLPGALIGKGNLAVTAASPARVYALIEAKPGGGVYRSDDAGQTWIATNTVLGGLVQRPFYYTTLGADPTNADVLYAGAESFYKSVDAGKTFTTMRTPHGDNHDIWVSPRDGNVMIQANDGGANVSLDGGRTWSSQQNQVTSEIYGIWVDNAFPYKLYGAQQDNSTFILSSVGAPYDRESYRGGPGCETGPIMPHPTDPNTVYGSCKGQYGVMDLRTGQEKNYWVGAQSLYGNPASDLILRFQRVSPMATSPHDPEILYYGSQHLHRTRDKGVTWETISPDLTAKPACCQGVSGEPITRDVTGEEFYSTLYAITESPLEKGVIWTGSNDGPFYVTRDDGKTWTNVTPPELRSFPTGGRVQWIEASPHRRGSAYYAMYRYLLGDYQPYIYRTDDYGRTWARLTDGKNGIPADWPTRVVREDPAREGLLYAGTEFGMFISFDYGARWQPFNLNMPHVPITDIKIHRGDLIVSTQGRAIWILDNISALGQMALSSPAASARQGAPSATSMFLFKPRDGYRTRVSPNLLGPRIDYYLPSVPDGAVTIEILDAQGAVVNSYSSNAAVPGGGGRGGRGGGGGGAATAGGAAGAASAQGRGAAPMTTSMEPPDPDARPGGGRGGGGVVSRVTKTVGINRFVWNVQHQSGLPAPPGTYQVRLKAGDATLTQPLRLRIDPNVAASGVTEADLVEQFEHNLRMRELVAAAGQTVARVRQARGAAAGAAGTDPAKADLPGATTADPTRASRLTAIYEKLVNTPEGVRYNKPGLEAHIRYLQGMTTGVDQKVGRDALARYQVLKKELDAIRAELDKVLGGGN